MASEETPRAVGETPGAGPGRESDLIKLLREVRDAHARNTIALVHDRAQDSFRIHPELVTSENAVRVVQFLQSLIRDLDEQYARMVEILIRDGPDDGAGNPRSEDRHPP